MSSPLLRTLFLRIYAAWALVLLIAVVTGFLWFRASRRVDRDVLDALPSQVDMIRDAMQEDRTPRAVRALAHALHADVYVVPLHPTPKMPRADRALVAQGEVALPRGYRQPNLWIPLVEEQLLVHVVPRRGMRPVPVPLLLIVALLAMGAVAAASLRPLQRELDALAQAADAFGRGQLDARANASVAAGGLSQRFNQMADRVTALLTTHDDLLTGIAHELGTPLNRVRFGVELLADEPDPDERTIQVEEVQRDLDALEHLVAQLHVWSTARHPSVAVPIDLAQLAASESAATATPLDIDVTGAPSLWIAGSPELLRSAVAALMSNATRHAHRHVQVTLASTPTHSVLVVDDDGPGVPAPLLPRLTEPFFRVDSARADKSGAGLGLAITDRVARSCGGSVHLERSPLGGLRAVLTFPRIAT